MSFLVGPSSPFLYFGDFRQVYLPKEPLRFVRLTSPLIEGYTSARRTFGSGYPNNSLFQNRHSSVEWLFLCYERNFFPFLGLFSKKVGLVNSYRKRKDRGWFLWGVRYQSDQGSERIMRLERQLFTPAVCKAREVIFVWRVSNNIDI